MSPKRHSEQVRGWKGAVTRHRLTPHLAMAPCASMGHPKQSQQRAHSARQTLHIEEADCKGTALHSFLLPEAGQTPKITPSLTHPPSKMETQPIGAVFTALSHHHQQPLPTPVETWMRRDVVIKALQRKPLCCGRLGDAALAKRSSAQTGLQQGGSVRTFLNHYEKTSHGGCVCSLTLKKTQPAETQGKSLGRKVGSLRGRKAAAQQGSSPPGMLQPQHNKQHKHKKHQNAASYQRAGEVEAEDAEGVGPGEEGLKK